MDLPDQAQPSTPANAAEVASASPPLASAYLRDMQARGQVQQCTDQAGLDAHLASEPAARRAYAGFDPTADSLTIGNLVTIMALARFQRAGHVPIALMGGATGLIGDPSGKSAERSLSTREEVSARVERIRAIFAGGELFLPAGAGAPALAMVNNIDWLGGMGFLEALREIGKHFSVNMMIQKDSVKERLTNRDQGISYTEFSYMLLQAYDFYWLHANKGVTLQMGGSDQYGNIVVGMDLIGKKLHAAGMASGADARATNHQHSADHQGWQTRAFGLTWPLVAKADGTKFGKTESGAIWLSADRTSPYAYYQFWLNSADADLQRLLHTYTFLPVEQIAALMASHAANPGVREAQRTLAREATRILHGPTELARAEAAAQALFSGDVRGLDEATLSEVFASAPATSHDKAQLAGEGVTLLDVLVATGTLAKSKTEARQFLCDGSVSVNGAKADLARRLTSADLLPGAVIALRRGKKTWHLTRWG
jgi:tyrosyl-tRNA synthetase